MAQLTRPVAAMRSLRAQLPLAARAVLPLVQSRNVQYRAPHRDIRFVLHEVFNISEHYKKLGYEDVDEETVDFTVQECGKFCEEVLSPLNAVGDQGSQWQKDGSVKTPPGFKDAYDKFCAAGWQSLSVPEEYGGQGMPLSLGLIKSEMIGTANWSWGMFPGLSVGCMNTLLLHGTEEMKQKYLTKLAEGTWSGTMCLTEPHCGTDLGLNKTKAVATDKEGVYKITGTKIFISCGEHDLTENIIHIVLARIEGAPEGTKGISLFLVPKYLVNEDGSLDKKRNLMCSSIEKKMGIHASPTCQMQFEDSVGFLIGEPNSGLRQMFTFMNTARLGTALQGIGAADLAFQGALPYARDRLAMRALKGPKYPDQPADPIIVHPDVRKMLLTAKAFAEGGRALMYYTAIRGDRMILAKTAEEYRKIEDDLGVLTPILKGFMTEVGCEAASHCMQVFGGHGYIKDHVMEQIYRDARIGTMYEGTTGVQALDLLGRKIMLQGGDGLRKFAFEIIGYCKKQLLDNYKSSQHKKETLQLLKYTLKWLGLTAKIGIKASRDRDIIGSASVDYLMYSGYVSLAYCWLRMMDVASAKLAADPHSETRFYQSKINTGKFYFDRLLPRADSLADMAGRSPKSIMKMPDQEFDAHIN